MARPKEKILKDQTHALEERSNRAKKKVKDTLAIQLRNDILRLFNEEEFTDITIRTKSGDVHVHRFIIKTRSCAIFKHLLELGCKGEEDDISVLVMPDWLEFKVVKEVMRQLYISDIDVDSAAERKYLDSLLKQLEPRMTSVQLDDAKNNTVVNNHIKSSEESNISQSDAISNINDNTGIYSNTVIQAEINTCNSCDTDNIKVYHQNKEIDNQNDTNVGNSAGEEHNTNQNIQIKLQSDTDTETTAGGNTDKHSYDQESKAVEQLENNLENSENNLEQSNKTDMEDIPKNENKGLLELRSDPVSIPYETCSVLGEDLLRGYLQKIPVKPDCVLNVTDSCFKVHRCILCSRSTYFSAMMSGSWMESDADAMVLEGISNGVMEQILLYLYGGVMELNDTSLLGELVMAADMYGLEGMKDVVTYSLTKHLCHFFHKPCAGCETSVPDALTTAVTYNLTDLKDKCIRWINTNMTKVWRGKSFASLPQEVIDLCSDAFLAELCVNNVIEVMLDCQQLNRVVPHVRWSESSLNAVTMVMDKAIEFTSQNFVRLLKSPKFIHLNKGVAYRVGLLEEIFEAVVKSIPIQSACKVYLELYARQPRDNEDDPGSVLTEEYKDFVRSLFSKFESLMKLHIQQITQTKGWDLLSKDLQTQILKDANFVCIDNVTQARRAKPKLSSMQKKAPSEVIKSLRNDKTFTTTRPKSPLAEKPRSSSGKQKVVTGTKSERSKTLRTAPLQKKDVSSSLSHVKTSRLRTGLKITSSEIDSLSAASTESVDSFGETSDQSSVCSPDVAVTSVSVSNSNHLDGASGFSQKDAIDFINSGVTYKASPNFDTDLLMERLLEHLVSDVELAQPETFTFEVIPYLHANFFESRH